MLRPFLGAVVTCLLAGNLGAQRLAPGLPSTPPPQLPPIPGEITSGVSTQGPSGRWVTDGILPTWSAPIASAIVPGAGQAVLHQHRLVVYLAVEGFVWLQYFKDMRDWRQQRAAYRNLAAGVARGPFTANPPVGTWAYYEEMEHYLESGVYSANGSTTDVSPEPDESTYNGAMWRLARSTFWSDPAHPPAAGSAEYQRALDFYKSRAIRPEYRWSWRNAQLELDLYRWRINKANDAVRRATSDLGIVLANHVLSAVDAFAALQLRAESGPSGEIRVTGRVPLPIR